LPSLLFSGRHVLDVGCNEGWVTCEIAQSWGARKVVGVDIDDSLIRSAWRRRRTVWSLQAPCSQGIFNVPVDPGYFPASCEHEYGSLPIPPSTSRGKNVFPHNMSFRTADWTSSDIPEDLEGYDVVIAFSISKWIHLNDGDEGLKKFFLKVHSVLRTGGVFALEPQPWDSYAKAKRMNEKLKNNAKHLVIRPDDFGSILANIGFGSVRRFGPVGEGGFSRPIDLYVKL